MKTGDKVRVIESHRAGLPVAAEGIIDPPAYVRSTNPNPRLPRFQWVRMFGALGTWLLPERVLAKTQEGGIMTEEQKNFREAKEFRNRILRRSFEGMETYIGTNPENDRLVYDCYEKDPNVYRVGDYLGSVIFDTDREGAYQNEDEAKENLEHEPMGLNITRSNKG